MILFKHRALISLILTGFVIGLAISGCTARHIPVSITSTPTINAVYLPSDTPAPSKPQTTATPTLAELAPTASDTPLLPSQTAAATAFSDNEEKKDCLTILPSVPGDENVQGTLILYKQGGRYYQYRPGTGEEKEIPGKNTSFTVSPDGKYFAYKSIDSDRLIIISSDGQIQRSFTWAEEWKRLARWMDNQNVLIEIKPQLGSPSANNEDYPQTFMVFNPFTNEKKTLLPDFPSIDTTNYINWENSGSTIYDPSLTRVVYPKVSGESQELILWNIPEKKMIASFPFLSSVPKWSQDGSRFVLVGESGFEWITRDGDVTEISGPVLGVDYYSISPNNQYLAIWKKSYPQDQDSLSLLDIDTHQITNFCISAGFDPMHVYPLPVPIWSSDGRFLVIQANFREEDKSSDLVLIDMEKKVAAKIGSNAAPIGWLK
jgi:hypothetical protein